MGLESVTTVKKILIVDDERILRLLVRTTLESDEFQIIEAENGATALELVSEHQPDLVLLDRMMPGIDGLEVARKLRDQRRTADIPIIMLTAKGQEHDRAEGESAGVYAYLVKPFSPLELMQRVEDALGTNQQD